MHAVNTETFLDSLLPGDVLLLRNETSLGRLVRRVDGGTYNHTAIISTDPKFAVHCLPNDPGGAMLEQVSVQSFFDSGRYTQMRARRLDRPPHVRRRVARRAELLKEKYEKDPYAYDELVLGAIAAFVRHKPSMPLPDDFVRGLFSLASGCIWDRQGKAASFACSSFVWRSFKVVGGLYIGELVLPSFDSWFVEAKRSDAPQTIEPPKDLAALRNSLLGQLASIGRTLGDDEDGEASLLADEPDAPTPAKAPTLVGRSEGVLRAAVQLGCALAGLAPAELVGRKGGNPLADIEQLTVGPVPELVAPSDIEYSPTLSGPTMTWYSRP